ncbi:MAG: response regulator transcription factor [Rhodocyclaceae bacterium]|uniref:response regulator n=1 Tax=Uliginosibacterium sp. sgz301328 TaxID=3243764 RepID=UPI00359EB150
MTKHRVLIGDDHQIVRNGIRQLIEDEPDLEVGGEASTSLEILATLRDGHWDLVLLDIALPDRSGVDTLRLIRNLHTDLPVLILSGYPEDKYAVNLLRAGANGYVRKDAEPEDILRAMRVVLQGRRYLSPALSDLLVNRLDGDASGPLHHDLSQREFQVLCQLASGKTVSQIADELFLSVKTVSTYRTRILEKLNMQTNAELTYYAIKTGLIN